MASLSGSKIAPRKDLDDGRAAARKVATEQAVAATKGNAGKAQGDQAKRQVKGDDGSA